MAQPPFPSLGYRRNKRLDTILNQYSSVQGVHPLWRFILNFDVARCNLFERSFALELQKINRSSQDLEDGEINIYQKAFKILMDHPGMYQGAVHIYIDKILGLTTVGDLHRQYALTPSITFKSKMLACKLPDFICGMRITWFPLTSNAAHFKAMFSRSTAGDGNNVRSVKLSYSIEDTYDLGRTKMFACKLPKFIRGMRITWISLSPNAAYPEAMFPRSVAGDSNNVRNVEDTYDVGRGNGARNAQLISADTPHTSVHNPDTDESFEEKANFKSDDPKLSQLLDTYGVALQEFGAADPDTSQGMATAKFLRDTAENCVHYLETHEVCIMLEKLTEIRACLAEATVAAEKGMGGKRRRFDYDYSQVPSGPRQDKERKWAKRPKHSQARTRAESQRGYYDRYIPN
ncbi:MAG: hypothetical protein Q9214_001861 [Letrouitia sp. 1 TL-2023]